MKVRAINASSREAAARPSPTIALAKVKALQLTHESKQNVASRNLLQFRLRTLFMLITLVGVILGVTARVRYLQGRAEFHRMSAFPAFFSHVFQEGDEGEVEMRTALLDLRKAEARHAALAEAYERAVWRPWMIVNENRWLGPEELGDEGAEH